MSNMLNFSVVFHVWLYSDYMKKGKTIEIKFEILKVYFIIWHSIKIVLT